MPFELTRQQARTKTDLMAQMWEAHARLRAALDDRPVGLDPRRVVDDACCQYKVALRKLRLFVKDVAEDQSHAYRNQPLEWRRTRVAKDVRFWIATYLRFHAVPPAADGEGGTSFPPEAILAAFEELTDRP